MARNPSSRGGNRRSNNNNPEGRNQYNSGFIGMARERPAAAAAVVAGAAAAGVFLWSKRSQIGEQIGQLSDQIGEWTDNMRSQRELETVGGERSFSGSTQGEARSEFASSAIGGAATRGTRPAASARRSAIADTGSAGGSGTMSGGSLDTGPSGRGGD